MQNVFFAKIINRFAIRIFRDFLQFGFNPFAMLIDKILDKFFACVAWRRNLYDAIFIHAQGNGLDIFGDELIIRRHYFLALARWLEIWI